MSSKSGQPAGTSGHFLKFSIMKNLYQVSSQWDGYFESGGRTFPSRIELNSKDVL